MPVSLTTEGELEHHEGWHYGPETAERWESFRGDDPAYPTLCVWKDGEAGSWLCEEERLDGMLLRVLLLKAPREVKLWVKQRQ